MLLLLLLFRVEQRHIGIAGCCFLDASGTAGSSLQDSRYHAASIAGAHSGAELQLYCIWLVRTQPSTDCTYAQKLLAGTRIEGVL